LPSESLRTTASKSHYPGRALTGAKISEPRQAGKRAATSSQSNFRNSPPIRARHSSTGKIPADLTDRLVQALRVAGIGNPS